MRPDEERGPLIKLAAANQWIPLNNSEAPDDDDAAAAAGRQVAQFALSLCSSASLDHNTQ